MPGSATSEALDPGDRRGGPAGENPYAGLTATLATMHSKEAVIAPALEDRPGLKVRVPPRIDTDSFGSFTGEQARPGDMLATARLKLQRGIELTGDDIGLASEGAYGPDPVVPVLPSGTEILVFRDSLRSIEVVEGLKVRRTNYATLCVAPGTDISAFLTRIGFPDHAVAVCAANPENTPMPAPEKGLTDLRAVQAAIKALAAESPTGQAIVQADMRAHVNPTRMKSISTLAEQLARRLMSYCPECASPGFGVTGRERGLPCGLCHQPTEMTLHVVEGCSACGHFRRMPREDGLETADAQYCDLCNP